MQVDIIVTPCPTEASNHLYNRGWHTTTVFQTIAWSNNAYAVTDLEWGEALAYEMFMHLYHMKETPNGKD